MHRRLFWILIFAHSFLFSQNIVHIIKVEGVINPVSTDFIRKSIEEAKEAGAECLVIQLDTPGGLMKSMRIIVKDILTAEIPVVVYVAPSGSRAGSAGVFITLAAHVAAMAPGTNIGAAHPVTMGAQSDTSNTMIEKVTNDAVAFIKSIAEQRGRNAEWAEKAVRESDSITETEALELKVIDVVAASVDSLLMFIDGREVAMETGKTEINTADAQKQFKEMSLRYKILDIISDPNIAYILLLIGIYGIFFELYNPGAIFPGVIGVISLILAFYALHTLPVNYAGLLLILVAIGLFLLEIKVTSYGLLTAGGIVSLVIGSLMLFETPVFQVSWEIIAAATISTAVFFLVAIGFAIRAQRRRPATGREGLIGEIGEATANFSKGLGYVRVHGEIWQALSSENIKKGDRIRVTGIEGLKIRVEKVVS